MSDEKATNAPAADTASPEADRNEDAPATTVVNAEAPKVEAAAPAEAKAADTESAPTSAPVTAPTTTAETTEDKEPETPAEGSQLQLAIASLSHLPLPPNAHF